MKSTLIYPYRPTFYLFLLVFHFFIKLMHPLGYESLLTGLNFSIAIFFFRFRTSSPSLFFIGFDFLGVMSVIFQQYMPI